MTLITKPKPCRWWTRWLGLCTAKVWPNFSGYRCTVCHRDFRERPSCRS